MTLQSRLVKVMLVTLMLLPYHALISQQDIYRQKNLRSQSSTVLSQSLLTFLAHYQEANALPVTPLLGATERSLAFFPSRFLQDDRGRIGVSLRFDEDAAALDQLSLLGFEAMGEVAPYGILEGWLRPAALPQLDKLGAIGLLSADIILRPGNNAGSITSQADTSLGTYRVRNLAPGNVDGLGIRIGVLSDSYNRLGGAAAAITSGDLPANAHILADVASSGIDEGRAMMELIHDLAPGATQYFMTAFTGEAGFSNNIQVLADSGCEVMVDDIFYYEEPFFQDGIIAQKITQVTSNQDVIYFSAAGNRATNSYENTSPTFTTDPFLTTTALDFDPGANTDLYQGFTLFPGQQLHITLQWDDPFYTTTGVDTDLDLFLVADPPSTSTIIALAINDNISSQRPVETLYYANETGGTITVHLHISKFTGPTPGRIKYVSYGAHAPQEWETLSPTIVPHAGTSACVAVGAAPFWVRSPESFTSRGPSTFLFGPTGSLLGSPLVISKPEITAPDGCNNTFFGGDVNKDPDLFPNFFGTSASAPHAAAVAALVRQAHPLDNRDAILSRMIASAQDIHTTGVDQVTGHGLIDAFRSVYAIVPAALPLGENLENGTLGQAWELISTGTGRVQIYDQQGPSGGSFHMGMDTWFPLGGGTGLNEAILHIDASNASNLTLVFDQKEISDDDQPMSASFVGSENSDGVAMSVDGITWYSMLSLTGSNSSNSYGPKLIDLSTFASTQGLTLGNDVRIKFQQFGIFPITYGSSQDGMTFDNFAVNASIFPIDLISFGGTWVAPQEAELTWITANEQNNDFFRLERSHDGIVFEEIALIQAKGNRMDTTQYRHLDKAALQGDNLYRLWQVDVDGSQSVSETVLLRSSISPKAWIQPNPVAGSSLRVFLPVTDQQPMVFYTLSDLQGRPMLWGSHDTSTDGEKMELAVNQLTAGIYLLKIFDGERQQVLRVVRQ